MVSTGAPAFALSYRENRIISHEVTTRIADGMACRTPMKEPLDIVRRGAERIVEVTDEEVETAMRALFADTHNVAEGGGAAALAALLQDAAQCGTYGAVIVSGVTSTTSVCGVLASR